MKHINLLIPYNIIQDFQQIRVPIEADEQMLDILAGYGLVKHPMFKRIPYIGFGYTVLKCGMVEFYACFHFPILAQERLNRNTHECLYNTVTVSP
jgi:hypothetical protein